MVFLPSSPQERHFERRYRAARDGLHLPSEEELLRGMCFFREELTEDIREYAGRLSRRLKKRAANAGAPLIELLDELVIDPGHDGIVSAEALLDELPDSKWLPVEEFRRRFRIYRAYHGDAQAAAMVAGDTAQMVLKDIRNSQNPELAWRSLGWSASAAQLEIWERSGVLRQHAKMRVMDREIASYAYQFRDAITDLLLEKEEERRKKQEADDPNSVDLAELNVEVEDKVSPPAGTASMGVVVLRSVGNPSTSEGKRVVREFEGFVNQSLPLRRPPDLARIRTRLTAEFPYAQGIIDQFLYGLVGRQNVWFRPTILLGAPGCGKTRFAQRLVEELAMPYELVSCGGLSDGAIGGTARRWSSGEPSIAIMAIRRHECAGPVIILDEIEKVGSSRHNGNVHDVLVGLFEPETSRCWHDPYLESHCDLGHVAWLMTANSTDPIPGVLRDRCCILDFPEPGPEEVRLLAPRILERLYLETGHDRRWAAPLDEQELNALGQAWGGGSIRRLERLVEGLIEIRERERPRQ